MSQHAEDVDQIDFVYSPEQPLTDEQRIALLESEVAELREQLASLGERLCHGPWSMAAATARN